MNRYTKKLTYIIICIMFMNITTTYACDEDAIPIMTSTPNTHVIFMGLDDTKTFGSASYDPDDGNSPGLGIANLKWDVFRYSSPAAYIREWVESSSFTFNPSALGLDAGYYSVDLNVLDNDHTDVNSNYIRGWYVYNSDNERWYGTRDVYLIDCEAQCDEYVSQGVGIDISYQITPEPDATFDWSYNDVIFLLVDQYDYAACMVWLSDLMELPTVGNFYGSFHWDGKCGVEPFYCDYPYSVGSYIPAGEYQLYMYVEFPDYNYIYKQVDSITVTPFNILPAPTENGTKVMISTTHDNSYHTTQQTEDGKVRITVTTNPVTANVPVYFRTYDPDDKSSYETDPAGLDNKHTTYKLGDLDVVSGYSQVTGFTPLADGNGNIFEVGVLTNAYGKAEVDLNITNQYAGDNYIVCAGPNPHPHPGVDTDVSTDLLVAWKRVYLERDNMYKYGASVTSTRIPDSDSDDNDWITVDNVGDFKTSGDGSLITIFKPDGSSYDRTVLEINTSAKKIKVEDIDVTLMFGYGIKIRSSNPIYNETLDIPTDYIGMTFGENPDGSDGGTFVEFVDIASGGNPVPKFTIFPNLIELDMYCWSWFNNYSNRSNIIQLVGVKDIAVEADAGGVSNLEHHRSAIFFDNHTGFGENEEDVLNNSVVHELAHQFGLLPGGHIDAHVEYDNHDESDDCLMSLEGNQIDGIAELCEECISIVRGASDPLFYEEE